MEKISSKKAQEMLEGTGYIAEVVDYFGILPVEFKEPYRFYYDRLHKKLKLVVVIKPRKRVGGDSSGWTRKRFIEVRGFARVSPVEVEPRRVGSVISEIIDGIKN